MKIVSTINNIKEADELINSGADILLAGIEGHSIKMNSYLTIEEFKELKFKLNNQGKELFLNANILCHDNIVESYKELFSNIDFDGIYVCDVALIDVLLNEGREDKVIYNPETLITNTYDTNYYLKQGIKAVSISKEITLDDMKLINKNKLGKTDVLVHGHYSMFNTRRKILKNYFEHRDDKQEVLNNKKIKIKEEIRNEFYPVLEEPSMSSIYREKATCMIEHINELGADYIRIDGVFKDLDYMKYVIKSYKDVISGSECQNFEEELKLKFKEDIDLGFMFKKTIYKK